MRFRRPHVGLPAWPVLALLLVAAATEPPDVPGSRTHRVYFADTENELNVYHIRGRQDGATLLIIGGIHGNEPGGYLAADLYADLTLRRGNLIVVPRANMHSIHQDERGARGDLNRKFGTEHGYEVDAQIVEVLKELMRTSDAVLNLHDGSGFYDPVWRDDLRNPLRWGQSVIVDAAAMTDRKGDRVPLEQIASRVVEQVNHEIEAEGHRFRVNNTNTYEEGSLHKEQRGSATFFAVSDVRIPAFGVETSKQITDEGVRVGHQVAVINAFMDHFSIVPDHPRFALEPPALHYLAVSVDGAPPVVVENGGTLAVPPGSSVVITHVEANYERGLAVDAEGVGSFNDFGRLFTVSRDMRILVRKDKYLCGSVLLRADAAVRTPAAGAVSTTAAPRIAGSAIEAFRVQVSGQWRFLAPGETLQVLRGDDIEFGDPMGSMDPAGYRLNFRGFVGNPAVNDAEDRGYVVHTASDMLQRFSLSPDEERYEVRAEEGHRMLATAQVRIVDPALEYVLLRLGSGPLTAIPAGDTLDVAPDAMITVTDVVVTPGDADGLRVNFRGFAGPEGAEDRGHTFHADRDLLPSFSLTGQGRLYEILVDRRGLPIGRVVIRLGGGSTDTGGPH